MVCTLNNPKEAIYQTMYENVKEQDPNLFEFLLGPTSSAGSFCKELGNRYHKRWLHFYHGAYKRVCFYYLEAFHPKEHAELNQGICTPSRKKRYDLVYGRMKRRQGEFPCYGEFKEKLNKDKATRLVYTTGAMYQSLPDRRESCGFHDRNIRPSMLV